MCEVLIVLLVLSLFPMHVDVREPGATGSVCDRGIILTKPSAGAASRECTVVVYEDGIRLSRPDTTTIHGISLSESHTTHKLSGANTHRDPARSEPGPGRRYREEGTTTR